MNQESELGGALKRPFLFSASDVDWLIHYTRQLYELIILDIC